MSVKEAVKLLDERRKQLATVKAEASVWRHQVRVAERLLREANDEVCTAVTRTATQSQQRR